MNLSELTMVELCEVAKAGIGFRMGLRSSGQIKDDQNLLSMESQNVHLLDKDELIKTIEKHALAYKIEKAQL